MSKSQQVIKRRVSSSSSSRHEIERSFIGKWKWLKVPSENCPWCTTLLDYFRIIVYLTCQAARSWTEITWFSNLHFCLRFMLMMNVVIFSSNGNQEFITTSSSHPLSIAVEKYGFNDGQNHKLITFCGLELLQTPIRESHIVQKKVTNSLLQTQWTNFQRKWG